MVAASVCGARRRPGLSLHFERGAAADGDETTAIASEASAVSRGRRQAGVAILAVLWGTALLIALILGAVAMVRSQVAAVDVSTRGAQARALAEAGIQRAVAELTLVRETERWRADGTPHELLLADGRIEVSIQDASGLIDINTASEELLRGLIGIVGPGGQEGSALADAILDWRDIDNVRRPHGAEDGDYRQAALAHGAGDGPFDSVEQLRQVMGMNAEIYDRMSPWVTVYSGSTGVNPRLAPEPVLRSVPGLGGAQAARSYADSGATLPARTPSGREPAAETRPQSQAAGLVYRIDARAATASGDRARIVATIRLLPAGQQPYAVLSWRE